MVYATLNQNNYNSDKLGSVIELSSNLQLDELFKEYCNQLVVIVFTSNSSSACKSFRIAIDNFAQQYHDIKFVRVEMSNFLGAAERYGVSAAPTTHLYLNGTLQTEVLGYSPSQLQQIFEVYSRLTNTAQTVI